MAMLLAASNNPAQFTTLSGIMIVLGILIITVLMTTSLRRKSAKRASARQSPRELMEQIRSYADRGRGDDVDAASARFLDQTQQLMAQLDNKAARLEQLITDADDRLQRLSEIQRHIESPQPAQSQRAIAPTIVTQVAAAPSMKPTTASRTPAPQSKQFDAVSTRQSSDLQRSIDPLTRAVYDLADDGRRSIDIARELDEQIGKVELILALRGETANL